MQAMEQNVSYQERVHKERVKQAKELLHEIRVLNRKTETTVNKLSDLVIRMEKWCSLKKVHAQLGGERAIAYKTLWRWVDGRKKSKLLKEVVGKEKLKDATVAQRAIEKIKKGATEKDIKAIFREENKKSREDYQLEEMVENARRADFLINNQLILKKLDQEQLSNLHEHIKQIMNGLDKHFGVAKSKGKRVQRKKASKRSGNNAKGKKVANGGLALVH